MSIRFVFFYLTALILLTGSLGEAYPEFIGIGYTGCITCHFNGAGNGGLNDYGRGLFAVDVASKLLWNSRRSDQELGESSGFLGTKTLPFWFRPSFKYRGLSIVTNPGSKVAQHQQFYMMQKDFNLHIPFNEDQTVLLAMNVGMVSKESAALPNTTFSETLYLSREYYLRGQFSDNLWLYLGFMDKVFGIRHPDHTAVNRKFLGLGQNDQVHGLVLHYAPEHHEFFLNPYIGNAHLPKEQQFPGVNVHYEYEPAERWRVGGSFMRDRDASSLERNTLGLLVKRGVVGGHSVLAEMGVKNAVGMDKKGVNSFYTWTQATMRIARGLFMQSVMQYRKDDISRIGIEHLSMGAGLLFFPMQRLEWRLSGVNTRDIDPTKVSADNWVLQSQLHLSF